MEGRTRRKAAVELAVEPLRADLSAEVDGEGLGDRDHPWLGGDHRGVADVFDRVEGEALVAADQVVQPPRADRPARHHPAGDDARGDEVDDGLRDDVGVDREVAAVDEVGEHLIRDAADADLERGAVVDETGDVRGDLVGLDVGGFVDVLGERPIDGDERVDPVERDDAVPARARHRGVDLGDHAAGGEHGGARDVDRDPEAAHALLVGRRHLHQRDVDRHAPAVHQRRYVGKRERHVLESRRLAQPAQVAADVEDAMPIARSLRADAIREEVGEDDAGRRRVERLQCVDELTRRRARGPDEDVLARNGSSRPPRSPRRCAPASPACSIPLPSPRLSARIVADLARERQGDLNGGSAARGIDCCLCLDATASGAPTGTEDQADTA